MSSKLVVNYLSFPISISVSENVHKYGRITFTPTFTHMEKHVQTQSVINIYLNCLLRLLSNVCTIGQYMYILFHNSEVSV